MAEDPTQSDNPEGEDRPDWLPENFKTPEDLAASYRESQRKITEESTARRNLEALVVQQQTALEQWQQQANQEPETDYDEWYATDSVAATKALVEQAAQSKVDPYVQATNRQLQEIQAQQAKLVADHAYRSLEATRGPLDDETAQAMREVFAENPHFITDEIVADPDRLGKTLNIVRDLAEMKVSPRTNQSQADLQRTMKLQAQSATGAGGHLSTADEAQQRWQEIQNAPSDKLGL